MKKILIVLFFSVFGTVFSQHIEKTYEMTDEDRVESKKFRNNFFTQRGFSPFSEYFQLPGQLDTVFIRGDYSYDERKYIGADTIIEVDRGSAGALISYTYDLRYNLLNARDYLSISISSPLTAGAYMAGYNEANFSLALKVPVSIDLNFFLHSTYNNIQRAGLYLGGGYQRFQFLVGHKDSFNMPFARFGIKYPYRTRLVYLEVMYGKYPSRSFNIDGKLTELSSQYIKVTLGRLLKL